MGFFKNNIIKQNSTIKISEQVKESNDIKKIIGSINKLDNAVNSYTLSKINSLETNLLSFYKLSTEDKTEVLNNTDILLQEKLTIFMDENAKFSDNIECTNSMFRAVTCCLEDIKERKTYTQKEMSALLKYFQRFIAKVNIEIDRVTNTFLEYREDETNRISDDNTDDIAISKCINFKNYINSKNSEFIHTIQNLLKSEFENKQLIINELIDTCEKIQIDLDNYQSQSLELMNHFIPQAIQTENKFSKLSQKHLNNGTPLDLNLCNKIVTNSFIKILTEFLSNKQNNAA